MQSNILNSGKKEGKPCFSLMP